MAAAMAIVFIGIALELCLSGLAGAFRVPIAVSAIVASIALVSLIEKNRVLSFYRVVLVRRPDGAL